MDVRVTSVIEPSFKIVRALFPVQLLTVGHTNLFQINFVHKPQPPTFGLCIMLCIYVHVDINQLPTDTFKKTYAYRSNSFS